jgi:CheY-like chemotaxis protein
LTLASRCCNIAEKLSERSLGDTRMCSILLIDDDKGILFLIREVLTKFGHCVEVAMDGYEGIQKFDDSSFDIVITDMCMPGMDGRGVLEHIRNSPNRSTPVIGISGTPWLLRNEDFDMVLLKPFALQKLIDSVTSLTNLPLKEAAGA